METVFSHFANYADVNTALLNLEAKGFTRNDISLIAQEGVLQTDQASHTAADAGTGAGIGGIVGLIAGIGAVALPGIGAVIGTGTAIGGLISGAGAGSIVGGIVGFFHDLFGNKDDASRYEEALTNGRILLAVHARPANTETIREILASAGGEDIQTISK